MAIGVIIPVLEEIDVKKRYEILKEVCERNNVEFEVVFALNGNANSSFTNVRKEFAEIDNVRAIKLDMMVDEHRLITVAMKYCENYDATIIYSSKEEIDAEVVNSFITSWKAGNKIVYLKKIVRGFKGFLGKIKEFFYKLGIKILNVFHDYYAENDIQLLDQEVVRTINQLPTKNRQLRVLDSFVGYNVDIVSSEQDGKPSKLYNTKTKYYWINLAISLGLCFFGAIFFIIALVGTILSSMSVAGLLILWSLFIIFGVMAYIFAVKTMLVHRVGENFDAHEIKALHERAEKYNMKKEN